MTFRRGATLPVVTSFGYAESCDLGPTAGNGFYKRWPDDLALLADSGVEDLRLTFDWARLQPKPGEFSGAWVERYENMLDAADAVGIRVWATLYDSGVPKWFANEGGIDDDEALGSWWPRWTERMADTFGDRVGGWIPFATISGSMPDSVWTTTWNVLGGGEPPVASSLQAIDGFGFGGRRDGEFDVFGVALDTLLDQHEPVEPQALDEAAERWATALRDASTAADGQPLMISRFTPHHVDPDVGGKMVERIVTVVDDAIDDGMDVIAVLLEPAIAGPESPIALFDSDRAPQPAAEVFLVAPDDDDA